jgi:hypothetical protein
MDTFRLRHTKGSLNGSVVGAVTGRIYNLVNGVVQNVARVDLPSITALGRQFDGSGGLYEVVGPEIGEEAEAAPDGRCQGVTQAGAPCKRPVLEASPYCRSHQPVDDEA